jgi:hypothetical protein
LALAGVGTVAGFAEGVVALLIGHIDAAVVIEGEIGVNARAVAVVVELAVDGADGGHLLDTFAIDVGHASLTTDALYFLEVELAISAPVWAGSAFAGREILPQLTNEIASLLSQRVAW